MVRPSIAINSSYCRIISPLPSIAWSHHPLTYQTECLANYKTKYILLMIYMRYHLAQLQDNVDDVMIISHSNNIDKLI